MKKITLTITLLIFLSISLTAQWELTNEPLGRDLMSIDFINEDIGWVAGADGIILRTNNGGQDWETLYLNDSLNITMVDFISSTLGWAVTSGGEIINTIDAGDNWSLQVDYDIRLNCLYTVDDSNVYAGGAEGLILKTTNGGDYWEPYHISQDFFCTSIGFFDHNTGLALGTYINFDSTTQVQAAIQKTNNGGISWVSNTFPEYFLFFDLQIRESSICNFLSIPQTVGYSLVESIDTCNSWNEIIHKPYRISSYQFMNASDIYAVLDSNQSAIVKSTDGGTNWDTLCTVSNYNRYPWYSYNPFLNKIYMHPSGKGFAYGHQVNGTLPIYIPMPINYISQQPFLFRSTDYGLSWSLQYFSYPVKKMIFTDQNNGFLIGGFEGLHYDDVGSIFLTNDGANTWSPASTILAIWKGVSFINLCVGYGIASRRGGGTEVFRTTDCGANWEFIAYIFPSIGGEDIIFEDEERGWIVGRDDGAVIVFTSNGGNNWQTIWQYPDSLNNTYILHSICFADGVGWTVGDGGMIVKYTAQNNWQLIQSNTTLPLNKVFFLDENIGWISGGYLNNNNFQHTLLRTTDSGNTWLSDQTIPYLMNDVYFRDSELGWAVGCDEEGKGVILVSTDSGNTWAVNLADLNQSLVSICVIDDYAYVAGERGLILKTTNVGATWVDEKNNKIYPTEYCLEQNYPNPFNPTTTIKYQLPKRSFVTLKIYDVLGNEIETLVNEEQPQGVYETEFNCHSRESGNLSSGVYLYKLETDTHSETRKMILIK